MTDPLQRLALNIATVGPVGFTPIAPGTAGTGVGLALFWVVRSTQLVCLEVAVLLVVVALGIMAASAAETRWQCRDPGSVVIDEVAGMLTTLLVMPVGLMGSLVGFLAFRLFDVVKPFPARQAERLPGGWGVMSDDLVAGLYAQIFLRFLLWLGVLA